MTAIQIQTVVTILKYPTASEQLDGKKNIPLGCFVVSCNNCPLQHTEPCGIFTMTTSPESMIIALRNILSKVPDEDLLEALI